MLSVLSTLEETFFLWIRNFWYLVVLTILVETPTFFVNRNFYITAHAHPPGFIAILGQIGFLGTFVLMAAKEAAILGILRRQSLGKTAQAAALESIKKYTWTLFRLLLLIGIYSCGIVGIFALILKMLGLGRMGILIAIGFYLVFIKYALADPLVVVENLMARPALQRSWEMTKGHFWYVAGCYLVIGFGDWSLRRFVEAPVHVSYLGFDWLAHVGFSLTDSVWIVLSWCMYLRIKATDTPQTMEAAVLN